MKPNQAKLNIKSVLCSLWLCLCWLSILRKVLIHIRMAMYFRRKYINWYCSFVSLGIWRNFRGRAGKWNWNKSNQKQNRKTKMLQNIYAPVLRFLGCVLLTDEAKNERMRELAIKSVKHILVTMSRGRLRTHYFLRRF